MFVFKKPYFIFLYFPGLVLVNAPTFIVLGYGFRIAGALKQ